MKKILIFFVLFLFPFLVNAEGNVVVSSVENIYEEESGISIDESESRNIIFNDIGQSFKYKVVLENISDETLVVENIKLSEPVVDFMKYGVFDIEVGEELEAGAKKELYVTVDSLSDKGYGYNFADTLNLEVVFNEKVENPITVDIIVLVILSFIVSGIFFIYYKYNNKVSLCFLFIPLMVGGTVFVRADNFIKINFESNVVFESQNVLEPTGIYYVVEKNEVIPGSGVTEYLENSHNPVYSDVVDIWQYRSNIKEIFIENELREIDDYVYKFDISEDKNEKVIAYLVTNKDDNTLYDCYIMANGLIYANKNSQGLFAEMSNLIKINNLEGIDFSETTNMAMMFHECAKLSEINLSSFDTSNVKDMSRMFYMGQSLESLDLSSFDTSNVTDMFEMFTATYSIKELDVSNFDTFDVENFYMIFGFMTSLEKINLGDFKTDNAYTISGMFYNCPKLSEVDVSTFNTSNVVDMSFMFAGHPAGDTQYSGIKNIIGLSELDTSNVTSMISMFQLMHYIEVLDLSSFNTSNLTTMKSMFIKCYNLKYLDLSNFDFTNVTDFSSTFSNIGKDVSDFYLDLSGFDFTSFPVSFPSSMFTNFKNTHRIYVKNQASKDLFISKNFSNINDSTIIIKDNESIEGVVYGDSLDNTLHQSDELGMLVLN